MAGLLIATPADASVAHAVPPQVERATAAPEEAAAAVMPVVPVALPSAALPLVADVLGSEGTLSVVAHPPDAPAPLETAASLSRVTASLGSSRVARVGPRLEWVDPWN